MESGACQLPRGESHFNFCHNSDVAVLGLKGVVFFYQDCLRHDSIESNDGDEDYRPRLLITCLFSDNLCEPKQGKVYRM